MKETGVIKFNCNWIKAQPISPDLLIALNVWRTRMHKLGFIGVNNEEIGYGNMSIRLSGNQFIITGSATGKIKVLSNKHYTKVVNYDLDKNSLTAEGPILASSESLTHAVIYECDKNVNAIIHIHNSKMWNQLMNKVPTTNKDVEYGTPAMAMEMKRLYKETNLRNEEILVMAGHQDGIISFGKDLNEAGNQLLKLV